MQKLTRFFLRLVQEYLPDAYILAAVLSMIVFFAGIFIAGKTPIQMVQYWGDGYPSLFNFGMQMVMVLLTGYILALTAPLQKALNWITSLPKNPRQAVGLTAATSLIACYFNWGFGLVIGAFVAKAMGARVKGVHFPVLVAAAYGGEVMRGPSSSIPLVSATKGHFMEKIMGIVPVTDTLYTWWNILISVVVFGMLIYYFMRVETPAEEVVEFKAEDPILVKPVPAGTVVRRTFAETLENSWWVNAIFGVIPLVYLIINFNKLGFNLNLNLVIIIFLVCGLFLHRSPNEYLAAVKSGVVACRGILIQFPIYATMMSMMGKSGLVAIVSAWFVQISTPETFPLFTFLSAGLINFFIPSGGGQWAVQGPIMMQAAETLHANKPLTIMAFAWGDSWTNQIQPFWALPLLGVAGLSARDIIGYCVVWTGIVGLVLSGFFLALGHIL